MAEKGILDCIEENVINPLFFQNIVDQARDVIILFNLDGNVIYANHAAENTYGYTGKEFRGISIQNLLSPEVQHEIKDIIAKVNSQGLSFRTVHVRRNGETFPVEANATLIHAIGQEPIAVSIIRDISETVALEMELKSEKENYRLLHENQTAVYEELVASEEELQQQYEALSLSEEKFSKIFNFTPEIVCITQLKDGRYIDVNTEFLKHAGCTREEIIGKSSIELGIFSINDRERLIGGLITHGEVRNQETILKLKNGNNIHALMSAQVFNFRNEKYLLTVVHDITERKEMENQLRYKEEQLRNVLNNLPIAVSYSDNAGNILFLNQKMTDVFGYSLDDIPTLDIWSQKIYPATEYGEERLNEWSSAMETDSLALIKKPFALYGSMTCKDGSVKEIEFTSIIDGNYTYAVFNDITEQMKAERALMLSEQKYRTIFEAATDGIFIHDFATGNLLDINQKASEFTGYTREEVLSGKCVYFDPDSFFNMDEALRRIKLAANGEPQLFEWKAKHRDGHDVWEEVSLKRTLIDNRDCVLSIVREISERKRMEEQLIHLGLHDGLTQLYNRAYFEEQLKQLNKAGHSAVGLLMCDVDGLKIINDTLGHSIGDVILQTVANILRNSFRSEDLIARIGGDEFVIVLQTNSQAELAASRKRIEHQIEKHNNSNPNIPISLSIGYALIDQTNCDSDALIKNADNNMYREKLHRQKSARNSIVLALMKALEARDFLTEGHGERLENMIQSFAYAIGLPEDALADLRLLAQFHDIGKVGIPDSILFKPSSLTADEWVIMKQHSEIGYRIAKAAPDLAPIADWIFKHHEHWNGSGYPNGISGEDIPLMCRMLAIVDAYDAMTSDRPYSKAKSSELAIAELRRCSGVQFDPNLIEPFIAILK